MRSAPLEMPQMRPVSRLSSLLFSLCVGSICFRRVTSWAVRAVRGRGSREARTGPAVAAEGHRDACFTAAPTPAFCPSGALTILFKKKKICNLVLDELQAGLADGDIYLSVYLEEVWFKIVS